MPPRSTKRGSHTKEHAPVDIGRTDTVYLGGIASLQRLLTTFEKELAELKKQNMEQNIPEYTDSNSRQQRIISLLTEFSVLAEQETAFTPDLRGDARSLHKRLLFALSSVGTTTTLSVPTTAPELFSERENKDETAIDFTVRVYGPLNGIISLKHIRKLDFPLYNTLSLAKSRGHKFPEGFSLPTQRELTYRRLRVVGAQLDDQGAKARNTLRLLKTVERRIRYQRKQTPT
jgi:hypothetical protein